MIRHGWRRDPPPEGNRRIAASLPVALLLAAIALSPTVAPGADPDRPDQPAGTILLPAVAQPETPAIRPGEAVERAVDGAEYTLGPGDGLTVAIFGPQPFAQEISVDLEGGILIPNVGGIGVAGLTLDEARARIGEKILQRYRNVEVTVSLTRLRRFQVHLLGRVNRPGTYLATPVDRLAAAIRWAGGIAPRGSERRIEIQRADSSRLRADLLRYSRRGESSGNPPLREGDVVFIPFAQRRCSVLGAVHRTGGFEFVPGDRLSDALAFAGGVTRRAQRDSIEIARYRGALDPIQRYVVSSDGAIRSDLPPEATIAPEWSGTFQIDGSGLPGRSESGYPDILLAADDMIFVRYDPERRKRRTARIEGEVLYPGRYPVEDGATRLSELIREAGGTTPEAFLRGARLIRVLPDSLKDNEYERLKGIRPSEMTKDEYEYFKLKKRETPGLMSVDFQRLLEDQDGSQDILLQAGDQITIPAIPDYVSVLGMVRQPGNVPIVAGLDADDYIAKAGGYAENAERKKTRIIKAATGEWVSLKEARDLGPGDTIWIPEKSPRDWIQTARALITVATQIVTIYLVVDRAVSN